MTIRLFATVSAGVVAAAIATLPMVAQAQTAPTDYDYVGVGVGVGNVGDSDVGFAVNSKFTLGDNVSVRPGAITDFDFDDGQTHVLVPVTYDFNPITPNGKLLPYAGAGLSVETGEHEEVGGLLTAGADYRLTERLTANAAVNWSISDTSPVNGVIGVGYTF